MGYKIEFEAKLIRRKHVVDFYKGTTFNNVAFCMKDIPQSARFVDIDYEYDENTGELHLSLIFLEEVLEKPEEE